MTSDEILLDCEERMEKAVDVFRNELRGLRTGRATPALVDSLRVEYYGSPTPLKAMAQIKTPHPPALLIPPVHPAARKTTKRGSAGRCRRCPASSGRRWSRASRSRPRRPGSPPATSAATATR